MSVHPVEKFFESFSRSCLHGQRGAELTLVTGPPAVKQQDTGHLNGQCRAVVVFNQSQCQIDTGRNTCTGKNIAVLYVDGILLHADFRVTLSQAVSNNPMGGNPTAIEKSGSRKKECPTANGYDSLCFLSSQMYGLNNF